MFLKRGSNESFLHAGMFYSNVYYFKKKHIVIFEMVWCMETFGTMVIQLFT